MRRNSVIGLLEGGDRRSIGCAERVAEMVRGNPRLFPKLIACLWYTDPVVRMRAADAAEKVTRENPELLLTHKKELLGLLAEERQQEVRWHLAVMVPRLALNATERQCAVASLQSYLQDRSSIVRTFALQGLADLARSDAGIRAGVIELLRETTRKGTPAMKARSRKLLAGMEKESAKKEKDNAEAQRTRRFTEKTPKKPKTRHAI
jgi:hypothetical protein